MQVSMDRGSVASWVSKRKQCTILGLLSASTGFEPCFQLLPPFLSRESHVGKLVARSSKA